MLQLNNKKIKKSNYKQKKKSKIMTNKDGKHMKNYKWHIIPKKKLSNFQKKQWK